MACRCSGSECAVNDASGGDAVCRERERERWCVCVRVCACVCDCASDGVGWGRSDTQMFGEALGDNFGKVFECSRCKHHALSFRMCEKQHECITAGRRQRNFPRGGGAAVVERGFSRYNFFELYGGRVENPHTGKIEE